MVSSPDELAPTQKSENWDKVVEFYDAGFRPTTDLYAQEALRLIPPVSGQRVLDVAAGSGAMSFAAARMGADVLATDFSPAMIAYLEKAAAEQGVGNIQARVMDGQDLDLEDASFDLAFSVFGLMFFPSPEAGLREILRVLKPGGRAGIYIWTQKSELFQYVLRALLVAVPDFPVPAEPPPYARLAEPENLKAILKKAGFARGDVYIVARPWVFESADKLWSHLPRMSPAVSFIFDGLTSEQADVMGRAFLAEMQERFGAGPVAFNAEAVLGVGTK